GKFVPLTTQGILLGFCNDNYNYQIYDLETCKIVISHDVTFAENVFPAKQNHELENEKQVMLFDEETGGATSSTDTPDHTPEQVVTFNDEGSEKDTEEEPLLRVVTLDQP
ncbi:hypothetical protein CROQUDRAFT_53981, partial [Cronartium quercuum f. sp. fusiforme G11]